VDLRISVGLFEVLGILRAVLEIFNPSVAKAVMILLSDAEQRNVIISFYVSSAPFAFIGT